MRRTLYLVDDHAVLRNGLTALLEPAGFDIVGEGFEFDDVLADIVRLQPAAILLDLSLGDRSGLELLGEIERRHVRSRTLVLTMLAQPRQVTDAVRMGAMGYLLKGATGRELIEALEGILAGRHVFSPEIASIALQALAPARTLDIPPDPMRLVSLREREVLGLIVRGRSSAAVAETLHLSVKTVETYRSRLMKKLGIADITGLVRFAVSAGLVDAEAPIESRGSSAGDAR